MADTFLTRIEIKHVRHLRDISIPLATEQRKHLILTGKNGSGKTSVLEALKENLEYLVSSDFRFRSEIEQIIKSSDDQIRQKETNDAKKRQNESTKRSLLFWKNKLLNWTDGVVAQCDYMTLREKYNEGNFIIAYYKATRFSKVETSNTIEHIELQDRYQIQDTPGTKLVKYMVGLKATQAFAAQKKDTKRVEEIENWFRRFEGVLKSVFEDPSLTLDFDIENFRFSIIQKNRNPFDFNTLSSGYAAVFDIINDLIMRAEKKGDNIEGVVLIDEIETHLHLELQKKILPLLVQMYPRIQFIVSTHSPFILSSIDNAVIFDLENKTLVSDGMSNLPYEGIVEGYFETDRLSDELREKFERYKTLVSKEQLSDEEYAEIMELEVALDEMPDYLALEFATEYQRLKLEFENRE